MIACDVVSDCVPLLYALEISRAMRVTWHVLTYVKSYFSVHTCYILISRSAGLRDSIMIHVLYTKMIRHTLRDSTLA